MKLTTNFVHPVGDAAPILAAASWVVVLMALASTIALAVNAYTLRGEIPALNEHLTRVQAQARAAKTDDPPPRAQLTALKRRVALLNGLAGGRGQLFSVLLTRLEPLMPAETYLVSLHYRQRAGETQLVAEAQRAEVLTRFLLNLEKSEYFSEVLLTRQSLRTVRGRKRLQFELRLKEKS